MRRHEKKAFFEYFTIYFVSVALLILAAGFFYFEQVRGHFLKSEEFSIIEYARHIKMGDSLADFSKEFKHEMIKSKGQYIHINNFSTTDRYFVKLVPMKMHKHYMKLYKSKEGFNDKLYSLKIKIWLVQIGLLLVFAFISYILAKNALKPLQESVQRLDKFAKDLIHDLNTPVTSIKLNMKLLEKKPDNKSAFKRLNKSVYTISELHENLTILLQEETFQLEYINICDVVDEVVQIQKQIFPTINFQVECINLKVKVNQNAMKQILQNIISNGCKYNTLNGSLSIYIKNNALYIQDTGKGIKEPEKIFERSYSNENSTGIGLDIVKRLAQNMDIQLSVHSDESGSVFIISFK